MRSVSDLPAVFQHQDVIRVADRTGSLCHNNGRCAAEVFSQRLSEPRISLIVERAGGVVQDQNLRMGRKRSGNQDALLLPSAQIETADGKPISGSLLQFADKRTGLRALYGSVNFLITDIPPEPYIFLDRVREEDVILERDAELFMKLARRNSPYIIPVDANRSLIRVVKADQKVNDRTLPASGRADNSERLPPFQSDTKKRHGRTVHGIPYPCDPFP